MVVFFVILPGLDVLRHDAPRQVVVAVVASWVIKEIRPGGEDVAGQPRATLWDQQRRRQHIRLRNKAAYIFICLPTNHAMAPKRTPAPTACDKLWAEGNHWLTLSWLGCRTLKKKTTRDVGSSSHTNRITPKTM